jgi:hypothetical protein
MRSENYTDLADIRKYEKRFSICLLIIPISFLSLSLFAYLFVIGLLALRIIPSQYVDTNRSILIEAILFVFMLLSFIVAVYGVIMRESFSQRKRYIIWKHSGKTLDEEDTPRSSFWDAFPFASIVFFLVSIFMLFDVATGITPGIVDENIEKLLIKVALYLVGALVTGIVVLFGAHLVRFEDAVRRLTVEAKDAGSKSGDAAHLIGIAYERAKKIENNLLSLASTAGLSILSLRSDSEYRKAAQGISSKEFGDRYISARSSQAIMADDAICLNADHSKLDEELFFSARNMISSFLEEMAWDLGERCLVTNARNYTNFLAGAARGFEDLIDDGFFRGPKENYKIFYLTHTLISPGHLLNWPKTVSEFEDHEYFSMAGIEPFMLDYMTYCRYFAASPLYIHGRLIRTTEVEQYKQTIARKPTMFGKNIFDQGYRYSMPMKCNRWGIPHWANVKIKEEPAGKVHSSQLYSRKHDIPPSSGILSACKLPEEIYDYLFCAIPGQGATEYKVEKYEQNHSLYWPLFHKLRNDNDMPCDLASIAAKKPDIVAVRDSLINFLLSDETVENLKSYFIQLPGTPIDESKSQKRKILSEELNLFIEEIKHIKETLGAKPHRYEPTDIVDNLLRAYEQLQKARWGFHGRNSNIALNIWEDVQTAMMILVNTILAEVIDNENEDLDDFMPWFSKTFHSNNDLGRHYAPDDVFVKAKADFGDEWNEEIASVLNVLGREEFALIGVLKHNGQPKATDSFVRESLNEWLRDPENENNNIKCIMGLKSSIGIPWKHAELTWHWPCSTGMPELKNMALYYSTALEKSLKIST